LAEELLPDLKRLKTDSSLRDAGSKE
jgi:hypothetical protein